MRRLPRASILLLILSACSGEKKTETPADAGKKAYFANCIACHSADPAKDGVLGPAIKGSSKELVTARVMKAEYPPDYKPKRETKQMAALPHLEKSIDDLVAFLNSP